MPYRGRFAPSPTGPLHAGSVVAALGSWLDARWHGGAWLVRIEDVDLPRCAPGTDRLILQQLERLGLRSDEPPVWQSKRGGLYAAALQRLIDAGLAFGCACTRKQLTLLQGARERHGELVYPGTCRAGLQSQAARAWRFRVEPGRLAWHDRRLGEQVQDVASQVGDFVLRRADGLFAYQLAVVMDDAEQDISDVVRGFDLADNTPRQMLLQQALQLPTPRYLHLPLVLAADGQKLSKQSGAAAIDGTQPLAVLQAAGRVLGLPPLAASDVADYLARAVPAWGERIATFPVSFPEHSS